MPIKKTIDDICKYSLKECAKETLKHELKVGIANNTLWTLIVSVRKEDKLCIVNENYNHYNESQIIGLLGLKNIN